MSEKRFTLLDNVLWLQNVQAYDHKKEGFDILNDSEVNRTLHHIYNNRNTIQNFSWVLPIITEDERNTLNYFNENFMNGVISFIHVDAYGSTYKSNIEKFDEWWFTPSDDLDNVKINANQRQEFLNMLLYYFELHLGSFRKPKSLQVLNDVFH